MKTIRFIMHWLLDFFQDNQGNSSMMRLGFYTMILGALLLAWKHPDKDVLILGILAIAAALKWGQKREENKHILKS